MRPSTRRTCSAGMQKGMRQHGTQPMKHSTPAAAHVASPTSPRVAVLRRVASERIAAAATAAMARGARQPLT